jgi:hypothetical protein
MIASERVNHAKIGLHTDNHTSMSLKVQNHTHKLQSSLIHKKVTKQPSMFIIIRHYQDGEHRSKIRKRDAPDGLFFFMIASEHKRKIQHKGSSLGTTRMRNIDLN